MLWLYASAAALAVGAAAGWSLRDARADRADAERMAEQQRLAARQAEKVDWSSAEFEKGRAAAGARERIVVREVEHVVERYRAGDQQCLDPDGVRIIAADVDASNAGRELAPALPASAAAR